MHLKMTVGQNPVIFRELPSYSSGQKIIKPEML